MLFEVFDELPGATISKHLENVDVTGLTSSLLEPLWPAAPAATDFGDLQSLIGVSKEREASTGHVVLQE